MSNFSKDFFTGCGALVLIGILLFIVVPLIVLGFKIALWLAVPVATLLIIIVGVALFGRVISEIKDRW